MLTYAALAFQPVAPSTSSQPSQVYVHDASAPAETGDAGHAYGLRPPADSDPDTAPLFNARGDGIKTLLGTWRTADGSATFDQTREGVRVRAAFHGLVPNGRYSLFVRQMAVRVGATYTPLDGVGNENSFTADAQGAAQANVPAPLQLPPGAQLVAFYHSDGVDHQSSLGNPGVNVHAQLILRVQ